MSIGNQQLAAKRKMDENPSENLKFKKTNSYFNFKGYIMQIMSHNILSFNYLTLPVVEHCEKEKIKIFCFSFILDMSKHFLSAAIFPQRGQKLHLQRRMKAMRNCWFLYEPWRIRPKICQFPSSVFIRCKSTQKEEEFRKCAAVKDYMILLGIAYGMLSRKRGKAA